MISVWELDHVFLATAEPAAVEAELSDFGMTFAARRIHEGQGTANACATFENAYLELLYGHDAAELASEVVAPLGLAERIAWQRTKACPFGICLRPAEPLADSTELPFATWIYRAPYMTPGAGIPIVTPPGARYLHEPLLFLSRRARQATKLLPPSALHRGEPRTLTGVSVQSPGFSAAHSDGLAWLVDHGLVAVAAGPAYQLGLEWNRHVEGAKKVFANAPMTVRW